jgi:hypothetical protein
MATIEPLLKSYEQFVRLPWQTDLAGAQRVWMAVYDQGDERRLRARLGAFENVTVGAGHGWHSCDLTDLFARWMSAQEYRESYFESPEDLEMALDDFGQNVIGVVREALTAPGLDERSVVAIHGLASLFGLVRASKVIDDVASSIRGRMLVFFPGEQENNNFRLLDARDGWNYLAIPITAHEG